MKWFKEISIIINTVQEMMFSQETADLVTLTEEIHNGKLYFFAVKS